jgi:hypothetical protein
MFDYTSRYYRVPDARYTFPDGRTVTYRRRRFLPDGAALPLLAEVAVRQGERLDLFAHRTLGDPLQFWRIADANDAMNPFALVVRTGRLLRVPVPQP